MESSSPLSGLSPAENLKRRLNYAGLTLRPGQQAMVDYVVNHPNQNIYSANLPTGYGKTRMALGVADVLIQQGRINRVLIVVPTDTQRTQFVEGVNCDIAAYGFKLRGALRCTGEPSNLTAAKMNISDTFVTTIQAIHNDIDFYHDLIDKGRWLIVCDEYHRLKEDGKWASTIGELNYDISLGMTATVPGSVATLFSQPDVEVSFKQAIEERAIRRVKAHIEHYFVDTIDDEGNVTRLTTETVDTVDEKKGIRFSAKYLSSIISSAHDCLEYKNLQYPGQHQMLVFAMNIEHARHVSDTLNSMYGKHYADWIGMSRTHNENETVLKRYKDNEITALVQVDKAGEGFDHPRASVLVFLQLLRNTTVKAIQHAGRGVRRNDTIPLYEEDWCDMFASPDTGMAQVAIDMAKESTPIAEGDDIVDEDGSGNRQSPLYALPELKVIDVEHERSELISSIPQKTIDHAKEVIKKAEPVAGSVISDERIKRILAEEKLKQIARAEELSDPVKFWRDKVTEATRVLTGNVCRLRHGQSIPKSYMGDVAKHFNTMSVRKFRKKHDEMSADDFKLKYNWIRDINNTMKDTREIPSWLYI